MARILKPSSKPRIETEQDGDHIFKVLYVNNREVLHASGTTEEEALLFLIRHVHRIARHVEALCIEERKLTEEQIDEVVLGDRDPLPASP